MIALMVLATSLISTRPQATDALQTQLAEAAIKACASKGLAVTVAYAGPDGSIRSLRSADGTDALSAEVAIRKAHTASRLGFASAVLARAEMEAPAYVAFLKTVDPQFVALGGGVPVRLAGQNGGAIGVAGGARPEIDEACADAALATLPASVR